MINEGQAKLPQGQLLEEISPEMNCSNIYTNLNLIEKIDRFLLKTYGFRQAAQLKTDNPKKKELYRAIIISELNRTYRYPEAVSDHLDYNELQAYQALDFNGKGYVEVRDFAEAKFLFKLPFDKEV